MMQVLLAAAVAFVVSTGTASAVVEPSHRQLKGSLADAPAVKLHVTFKRKSMKLHGQSEFDIYATPVVSVNGASVLYNGYASFQEEDTDFTYTFVDGSAYLTTADSSNLETIRCLPPHTLPFNKILPALNEATRIPSASVGNKKVECASGDMYKTTFAGVHYAICSSGEAGFTAVSSDLDIDVKYLDGPVSIEKPKLSDGSASCEVLAKATSLTPTALALATGEALSSSKSRNLLEAAHMAMDETECQCSSTPRPCILLHGLGNPNERDTLQDTPKLTKRKFGDIHGHAPCCSTIKYAVVNTVHTGWRNDTLQQKFCDHSLSISKTSNVASGTIDNTIIVTHSMGGLVMAGALANGKCKFSETTSWVAISSPMKGSMAADYLSGICSSDDTKVAAALLDLIGECPVNEARASTIYQDGIYTTQSIKDAYVAAQLAYRSNVTAATCSNSFYGLFSMYQVPSIIGGNLIPHKSKENDALVEFQSCLGGLDETMFGNHYRDKFYKPQLNHADTAFLTGEGLFKDSKKPFKWFECLPL